MYDDVGIAWRQLRNRPGFALATIVVLALGLGASIAVFSVLDETLLKPLAYPDARRIVAIHNSFPKSLASRVGVSALDYAEIRRHSEIFSEAGVYYFNDLTMTGAGAARHVDPVNVSASLFRVLGVKAALGHTISDNDDRYGAPKVAILSDALWHATFDANPRVLGRSIQLDGEPYTIVGVMPRWFDFPYPATQLWLPMALRPAEFSELGRSDKWLQMIARLAPGVTREQAEKMLLRTGHVLAKQLPFAYPENAGWHFTMRSLITERVEGVRIWLLLAFGAVLCVFLIACSNAGGLLLIRWNAAASELAVRAALGAGQRRIVRQILTETALLASGGCVMGMLLAGWVIHVLNRYGPVAGAQRLQTGAILFALAMTLIGTFVAGLAPGLVNARLPLEQILRSGATQTARRTIWRSALVAAQIAAAVVLISTAALLSRSFIKLLQVPPGFAAGKLWSGAVALSRKEYRTEDADLRFFQQLQDRIATLPGVERVSACTSPPFNPSGSLLVDVHLSTRPKSPSQAEAQGNPVLPGYFETMQIPLLRGRRFTERDRVDSARVLIVDREFVRQYLPDRDPIGQLVGIGGERARPGRIVGVVENVVNGQLGGPDRPKSIGPIRKN